MKTIPIQAILTLLLKMTLPMPYPAKPKGADVVESHRQRTWPQLETEAAHWEMYNLLERKAQVHSLGILYVWILH